MTFDDCNISFASIDDQPEIEDLCIRGELVHRHLDWWSASDWIKYQPFLIIRRKNRIIAALACPEYPKNVAWIRFYVVERVKDANDAWSILWNEVKKYLCAATIRNVHAIPFDIRFRSILEKNKGEKINSVVNLSRFLDTSSRVSRTNTVYIRDMKEADLEKVADLDDRSFDEIWRNTFDEIKTAFSLSYTSMVAEINDEIIGYQITTLTKYGCHLARLAVAPQFQRQGVAKALLSGLLTSMVKNEIYQISVNTQENNLASLALYTKFGFTLTGGSVPVYRISVEC